MDCIKAAANLSDGSLSVPLTVVGSRAHIWETRLRILNHNKISHPKAAVSGKVRLFSISLANPFCVFKWLLPPYSRASLAQCDLCWTTLKERNATLPMAIYAVDAVHLDIKCNIHLKCLLLLKSLVVCAGRKDVICFDSASLDCFKFTMSILRESLTRFILRIWTKSWAWLKTSLKNLQLFCFVQGTWWVETPRTTSGHGGEVQMGVKKWFKMDERYQNGQILCCLRL